MADVAASSGITRLVRLQVEATQAIGATRKFRQELQEVGQSASFSAGQLKGMAANAGQQLQDIAIVASAGGATIGSMAVQIGQLASGFGPLGVAAGTAITVLGVIPALMKLINGESTTVARTFEDAATSIQASAERVDAAKATFEDLAKAVGTSAAPALADLRRQTAELTFDISTEKAQAELASLVAAATSVSDVMTTDVTGAITGLATYSEDGLRRLVDEFGLIEPAAREAQEALRDAASAAEAGDYLDASAALREYASTLESGNAAARDAAISAYDFAAALVDLNAQASVVGESMRTVEGAVQAAFDSRLTDAAALLVSTLDGLKTEGEKADEAALNLERALAIAAGTANLTAQQIATVTAEIARLRGEAAKARADVTDVSSDAARDRLRPEPAPAPQTFSSSSSLGDRPEPTTRSSRGGGSASRAVEESQRVLDRQKDFLADLELATRNAEALREAALTSLADYDKAVADLGVQKSVERLVDQWVKLEEQAQKAGVTLGYTAQQIRAMALDQAVLARDTEEYVDRLKDMADGLENALSDPMEDFIDSAFEGKLAFGDFVTSAIKDLAKLVIQMQAAAALKAVLTSTEKTGVLGWIASAASLGTGGAAAGAGRSAVSTLASGASGGTGGMPGFLKGLAGAAVAPVVQIFNQSGARAEVREQNMGDGRRAVKVTMRDPLSELIGDGSLDRVLRSNFGLSRVGRR